MHSVLVAKKYLVGIDEVGRGPLAGPVSVGAFAIPYKTPGVLYEKGVVPEDLKNSKALSAESRDKYAKQFRAAKKRGDVNFVIVSVGEKFIDRHGIARAIQKAIDGCMKKLAIAAGSATVLLDGGLRAPAEYKNQRTIIKGDEKHPVIAAASIVAKVHRDKKMIRLARTHPEYGFEKHKGYGTRLHYERIMKYGPCKIHRKLYLGGVT